MSKSVKRQAQSKLNEAPSSKSSKYYDLNLITKDISMLESFYDFIDGENDIVNEYLSNHDLNDFLNYFKSYHLYKSAEFALVFKVCTVILMRIAEDLKEKHSLVGQNFADLFIENYKAIIHQYLISNKSKSAAKSCVKFVTSLILQGSDAALKIATSFNIFQSSFSKQLFVRSVKDDDVHTCVLECFASFFVVGSNYVIRKMCENKAFFILILRDLQFDKCDNVKLMIEILHEKIIKNNAVSKTTKVKLFNPTVLKHLIAVYEWKGEALNYDHFKRLTVVDERCATIRSELHNLMLDICSKNYGIVFSDNLCGQSKSLTINKTLYKLITLDSMRDFFSHPLKNDIVKTVLRGCPDLIPNFIEYFSGLLEKIVPEARSQGLTVVESCYELIDNHMIDTILAESLSYSSGEKFVEVAMLLCSPTKTLMEVVKTTENISEPCIIIVNQLKKTIINNFERIITWINTSECFESPEQRMIMRSDFQTKIKESMIVCGWNGDYESILTKELIDKSMFTKTKKEFKNIDKDEFKIEEDIDEDTKRDIITLTFANGNENMTDDTNSQEALKKCVKHFLSSPFTCIGVFVAIGNTIAKGKISLNKKQRRKLFDAVLIADVMGKYWAVDEEEVEKSELIRNGIFDVIVSCVDDSGKLMRAFYETVHPMRLLSVYGGTMSRSDQSIMYLLMIHQLYDTATVPYFDFLVFGSAVNEHFRFDAGRSAIQWRPVIESQCFNQLNDERMAATISHFPVNRVSPVSSDNKIHLDETLRSIYDPCFLIEWISQLLVKTKPDGSFVTVDNIELKVLFSKKIIHFLVMCQSSNSANIRVISGHLLRRLLQRLEDGDNKANESPIKIQIEMVLNHMLQTIESEGKTKKVVRLPSVFTNIYVRLLAMLANPGKKMFGPVWEMLISRPSFDLKYVPDFEYLMYSDKPEYRERELWCLQLLAESVRNYDDYLVLVHTNAVVPVLSKYAVMDQCRRAAVLALVRRCVSLPRVAEHLRRGAALLPWLVYWQHKDRESREDLDEIGRVLLCSVRHTEGYEALETLLTTS